MTVHRKVRAEKWGRAGERWAALFLRLKGYTIIANRLRTPVGEIDLVARRGSTLAIVEVKARADLDQAREALSPRQRHRLTRAATWLTASRSDFSTMAVRFDLILISPWKWPRHITDAWQPDN